LQADFVDYNQSRKSTITLNSNGFALIFHIKNKMTTIKNAIAFLVLMISVATVVQKEEGGTHTSSKILTTNSPIGNALIEYNHGNIHTHSEPDVHSNYIFSPFQIRL
jgi:hypothetical protein